MRGGDGPRWTQTSESPRTREAAKGALWTLGEARVGGWGAQVDRLRPRENLCEVDGAGGESGGTQAVPAGSSPCPWAGL